jgi:hypothetical protein
MGLSDRNFSRARDPTERTLKLAVCHFLAHTAVVEGLILFRRNDEPPHDTSAEQQGRTRLLVLLLLLLLLTTLSHVTSL